MPPPPSRERTDRESERGSRAVCPGPPPRGGSPASSPTKPPSGRESRKGSPCCVRSPRVPPPGASREEGKGKWGWGWGRGGPFLARPPSPPTLPALGARLCVAPSSRPGLRAPPLPPPLSSARPVPLRRRPARVCRAASRCSPAWLCALCAGVAAGVCGWRGTREGSCGRGGWSGSPVAGSAGLGPRLPSRAQGGAAGA